MMFASGASMIRPLRLPCTASRLAILAGLAALTIPACKQEAPKPVLPPPTVQIIEAKAEDVPIAVEWIGTLAGSVTASIRSQVSGTLMKMSYEEGHPVKKDDILFELDDRTYQAALADAVGKLAQANANLGKSDADVARLGPLLKTRAVSQQDYDNAVQASLANKAAVASAQAAVDKAQLNVDFTKIKSPIDGIAGLARGQVGDLVTAGNMELATVATVNPIKAYFTVSEQEYLQFRKDHPGAPEGRKAGAGREFQIILANGALYPHTGSFFASDITVNANTGALQLCAIFENPDNLLLPGQYGRIMSVTRTAKDAILVPQRAVNELQGIRQVAVVTPEGKASIRHVKVGPRVKNQWLIEEGLQPGDKVIVEGFLKVREGLPVSTVPFNTGTPPANVETPATDTKAATPPPVKETK